MKKKIILLLMIVLTVNACANKKHAHLSVEKPNQKIDIIEVMSTDLAVEIEEKFSGDINKAKEYYANQRKQNKDDDSIILKQAILDIQSKNFDEAQKKLNEISKLNPKNYTAKRLRAGLHLSKGELPQAKKIYQKLLEQRDAAVIEDAMSLSHIYMIEKNYDEALKTLDIAENRFSEKSIVYFYKARAYSEQKDFLKAREYFLKAKKSDPKYLPNIKALGYLEEYEGDYDQAYKNYERAIKLNPDDQLMRLHLAELYLKQKKYKHSKRHFFKLYEADKKNPTYLSKLSINHYYLNEYDQSKRYLNELIEAHPQHNIAYYYLGLLQEKTRDYDAAIKSFSKVNEKDEYYVDSNLVLAQILFDQDKKEDAAEHLIKVNKTVYSDRFISALGRFYVSEGKIDDAEKILKEHLSKEKDNVQYLFTYAQVLEEQKKFKDMEKILFSLIEQNPDHARALNYLGYSMLERNKNISDAFVYIERAYNISPENPYIMDSLGWAYYKKEQYPQALKFLKMAYAKRSDEAVIKEHIGDTYVQMKQKSKAKQWYKKTLKMNIDEDDQKRIKNKLVQL